MHVHRHCIRITCRLFCLNIIYRTLKGMVQYRSAGLPVFCNSSATPLPLSPIGCIQILTYLIWGILGAAIFVCVIRSCDLFDWFIDEQAGLQIDCGHTLKLGKVGHLFNSYSYYLYFFLFRNLVIRADFGF